MSPDRFLKEAACISPRKAADTLASGLSGKPLGRVQAAQPTALALSQRPTCKGVYTVEPADKAFSFMPMHAWYTELAA